MSALASPAQTKCARGLPRACAQVLVVGVVMDLWACEWRVALDRLCECSLGREEAVGEAVDGPPEEEGREQQLQEELHLRVCARGARGRHFHYVAAAASELGACRLSGTGSLAGDPWRPPERSCSSSKVPPPGSWGARKARRRRFRGARSSGGRGVYLRNP